MLPTMNSVEPCDGLHEPLTVREIEVLKLIGEGNSTKEIAHILGISFKTAACHRHHLLAKVGVHESIGLLRWAIKQGLVEL
jgi:DNA-binding NarL/FixJ family response regulator